MVENEIKDLNSTTGGNMGKNEIKGLNSTTGGNIEKKKS